MCQAGVPVRSVFYDGDAFGVQQSFHNVSIMQNAETGGKIDALDGVMTASHTITALVDCTTMAFSEPKHVLMIKDNFGRSTAARSRFRYPLSTVQQATIGCAGARCAGKCFWSA
jgi:hypothetical protein|eukprot:COSAG01_NODE_9443_length_2446_cov_1.915211_1_plen_114_part_00